MAYDLLKKNKIKFKKIIVPQDEKIKLQIKNMNKMSTFPQIFYQENNNPKKLKIGGYDNLCDYIEIKNMCKEKKLNKIFLKYII